MNVTSKAQATKDKRDKLDFIKIKHFYVPTDTTKKVKNNLLNEQKIFVNYLSDKRLILTYKEPLQPKNKIQTTQFKNRQRTWIHILPKKICKWPITTLKDTQISFIIKTIQIKTTLRYHFTFSDGYDFLKLENNMCMQGHEDIGILFIASGNIKWYSCYRQVWQFLKRLNRNITWPSISTPRYISKQIESREINRYLYTKFCSSVIHQSQKVETTQQIHPSTDAWINKTWSMYTIACYSAIKRNEILIGATTWMDLENIMLN